MGVFARLAQLIKANLNDLIDKAEDPSKILDQLIRDMNEQLINAKKQVAQAIADERSLQKQAEQEAANAAEWERKAMLAVRHGDDKLAMEALQRKQQHDTLAEQYKTQWQKHHDSVSQLKDALRILSDKIENAKLEKRLLEARLKRTEAERHINDTLQGFQKNNALAEFDRMKKKVDQMEAETEANRLLNEEYTGDHTDRKFKELEQANQLDEALVKMKQKMGVMAPSPEPEPPQQVRVKAPSVQAPPPPPSSEENEQLQLERELESIRAEEERARERLKRLSLAAPHARPAPPGTRSEYPAAPRSTGRQR